MRRVPTPGPAEARTFAQAEKVSEDLAGQVDRARQALSNYQAAHPVLGLVDPADDDPEGVETAREQAVRRGDQPDLHRKA